MESFAVVREKSDVNRRFLAMRNAARIYRAAIVWHPWRVLLVPRYMDFLGAGPSAENSAARIF